MKTIMLKPELNTQLQELRKEVYKNTFIDYSHRPFINQYDIESYIQDNLYDFGHTSEVEDTPNLDTAQIRTNIGDFEVSFSDYCYGKSHDHNDADIYRIESVDILLTKI